MFYLDNLTELDWIAIGSIGTFILAIGAFISLFVQDSQFKKLRKDESERQFKNSSITLITKFDKDFQELEVYRFDISNIIINYRVIENKELSYESIRTKAAELYDFFDTLGYFVKEKYIKSEVVHQYFYYWFSYYYEFYNLFNIKKLSEYDETVWINLEFLSKQLNIVETKQLGREIKKITDVMLKKFFLEESTQIE